MPGGVLGSQRNASLEAALCPLHPHTVNFETRDYDSGSYLISFPADTTYTSVSELLISQS